jgi:hypothetical protein
MDIVSLLTEPLGIGRDQVRKWTGSLFNLAKAKDHFRNLEDSQVSATIPDIGHLSVSAPVFRLEALTRNGLSASLGGGISGSGKLADAAAGFSSTGLILEMIGKLIPAILLLVEAKSENHLKRKFADVLV